MAVLSSSRHLAVQAQFRRPRGTNGDDTGTTLDARPLPDVRTICAFGGNDEIYANGAGNDTFLGQTENDTIMSNDGQHDYVDGGTGANKCTTDIDTIDTVKNC